MTNPIPAEILEQRAEEQRRRIRDTVTELRSSVRERLDAEKLARQHLWQAAAGFGFVAFVIGYGVATVFTD